MSTSFPNARLIFLSAVDYLVHPEFRRKELHVLKNIRKGIVIFLFSLFCFMALKTVYTDNKIGIVNIEFWKVKKQNEFLLQKAKQIVYQNAVDSFLNSGSYLRVQAFKESSILLPDKISDDLVVIAVLEARKNKIPLRILFRVMNQESGYDTNAINPESGAWGVMQTLPQTFNGFYRQLNLQGGKTAANNIRVGLARLKYGYDYWCKRCNNEEQIWKLSLSAYTAGDSITIALKDVAPSAKDYVDYVMKK